MLNEAYLVSLTSNFSTLPNIPRFDNPLSGSSIASAPSSPWRNANQHPDQSYTSSTALEAQCGPSSAAKRLFGGLSTHPSSNSKKRPYHISASLQEFFCCDPPIHRLTSHSTQRLREGPNREAPRHPHRDPGCRVQSQQGYHRNPPLPLITLQWI